MFWTLQWDDYDYDFDCGFSFEYACDYDYASACDYMTMLLTMTE